MKSTINVILLVLLFGATLTYAYAFAIDSLKLIYFSKPLIAPFAALYYISIAKNIDRLFLASLFFAFLGNVMLIKPTQGWFVSGMASNLLFILINMVIVANKIGEMNTLKFFKISLFMVLSLLGVLYFMFGEGEQLTMLFYVFGVILAIYGSFSIYMFFDREDKMSLLNLAGVVLYILGAIARGFDHIFDGEVIYRLFNIITYGLCLYLIASAYAISTEKSFVKN